MRRGSGALVAAHVIIGVSGGQFISMTDPPRWAAPEVAACQNTGWVTVVEGVLFDVSDAPYTETEAEA